MHYTVTLSGSTTGPVTYAFSLGGGSASGSDFAAPVLSHGVLYDPVSGTLTVPAGVRQFGVAVDAVDDALLEPTESVPVSAGAVGAQAFIVDNDAPPTHVLPAAPQTVEDQAVVFGQLQGNALGVAYDPATIVLTTVQVTHGTLHADTAQGVTLSGNDSDTLQLSGSASAIQAALDGLRLVPAPDFNGTAVLTISSTDGVHTATDSVLVVVAPQTDAVDDSASTLINTPVTLDVLANDGFSDPSRVISAVNGVAISEAGEPVAVPAGSVALRNGQLVFTPEDAWSGPAPSFSYTVSCGTVSETAWVRVSLLPLPHAPVAVADTQSVVEGSGTAPSVVVGDLTPEVSGQDFDADGATTFTVSGVAAGLTDLPVGSVGSAVQGVYGTLSVASDGSYSYALNNALPATNNLVAQQTAQEVFTYAITDDSGLSSSSTLTITVIGSSDTSAPPPTVTPLAQAAQGFNGAYYGYNDQALPDLRVHSDDTSVGNLDSLEDVTHIIDGRQAMASDQAPDVTFLARTLDYGFTPAVDSSLGMNGPVAPGSTLPPVDASADPNTQALSRFLNADLATAVAQTGGANADGDAGLGTTTDAAIRISGRFFVAPGYYDFRVTADDGFRLNLNGRTALEFDGNQGTRSRIVTQVPVTDPADGLASLDLLYWDQANRSRLRVEFKPSSSSEWQTLSLATTPLFGNDQAPVLSGLGIEDFVHDTASGQWQLRTGAVLDGTNGSDSLFGGDARDYLTGGNGDDSLYGGAGADTLLGGAGKDWLQGGDGNDLLIGGAGADTLVGGAGDDVYVLSDSLDLLVESVGQGTDTIVLDAAYVGARVGSTYVLAAPFENLSADNAGAINLTGNTANNRLEGNDAANRLSGLAGNDVLTGHGGNDVLTGGAGADTFVWGQHDGGNAGAPAIDRVTDFRLSNGYSNIDNGSGAPRGGGDVLDLRDLLVGEHTSTRSFDGTDFDVEISNLLNYVYVIATSTGTEFRISSKGRFTADDYIAGAEDQRIVLDGVDLFAATGIDENNETLLLQALIKSGTILVD